MVVLNARFCEFIEPAPVCSALTALSIAAELLHQQGCNHLVVMENAPGSIGLIGLVHLHQFLSFLGQPAQVQHSIADVLDIETLPCVHEEQFLSDYAAELMYSPTRFWAVIDDEQGFSGLVDTFYLRKFLALTLPEGDGTRLARVDQATAEAFAKPAVLANTSESLWHQVKSERVATEPDELPTDMLRLKQQLRLQIDQLRSQAQTHHPGQAVESSGPLLRSLMQCLERLPLPLMLQTTAGSVIARNRHWQDQLGGLIDPSWVQREAAAVLEYAMPPPEPSVDRQPLESPIGASDPLNSPPMHTMCQVGTAPDSCVCICPLKNGQERILQFIKIPLGSLLSGQEMQVLSADALPNGSEPPFKLAMLDNPLHSSHPSSAGTSPDTTQELFSGSLPAAPVPEDLWLVLAQDVTEQQQLARELAAKNADLVQLNRLKDEFLACISHELRTPLTAVLGLSSLLKDQLSGSLNERQVRYAQLIYRSGRHLMTIVNDILDLTRIETGQLELSLEQVNVALVCQYAFDHAQQMCLEEEKQEHRGAPEAPIQLPEFSCTIDPGLETLVADEVRLRQMLVHLLSNALKFTPPSGRIGLNVGVWEGWIAFTVWDTGIGIPTEKQHLIFQKFQQLENPLTRRFEGAGLGLVLTQRLARLHGGDISFTSKENQGSQFTVLLPPTHPQPTIAMGRTPQTRPTQTRPTQTRLVLVVEAVVKSIEKLGEYLSELGYRVVIARSGTEAVEKARRLQPCAVFLNPLLPTLSGWDVLTILKADAQTRRIPVIVMGTRSDREQAYRNQADGFLSLPIAKKPLKQVLNQFTEDDILADAPEPTCSLVVLRISPTRYENSRPLEPEATIDLNALLHSHNYRVLEADDLEQAELLAQVWKPNVVVLDPVVPDPVSYLKRLGEQTFLTSLPLVTLDAATTQAANQVAGLSVFPCLAPLVEQSVSAGQPETSALLQVIQVAAGFAWRPLVLAIDSAKLINREAHQKDSEWLQALMQYLQTAGFRGMIARSRSEALQKLQTQSVDLLLVYWHETELNESSQDTLDELKNLDNKPPVLVIDHYSAPDRNQSDLLENQIFARLTDLSTQTLPPLPMEELLNRINQMLTHES